MDCHYGSDKYNITDSVKTHITDSDSNISTETTVMVTEGQDIQTWSYYHGLLIGIGVIIGLEIVLIFIVCLVRYKCQSRGGFIPDLATLTKWEQKPAKEDCGGRPSDEDMGSGL